jgi:hypothetical protein
MNKLVNINPVEIRRLAHPDKALAVESVTAEGAPYTFATIFRNKHGRTNLSRVGVPDFLAGGKSHASVVKYARTLDPNTSAKVFIESHGRIVNV